MQRIRLDRRQLIKFFVCLLTVAVFILLDQLAKNYFVQLNKKENLSFNKRKVLGDFFYFTFLYNTGSAYGMLSGKPWAMTFFIIITPIATLIFILALVYSVKNKYNFLTVAIVLILSGTLGNYVDRVTMDMVVDFLCIQISGNAIFGVFNIADVYLSIGMVMTVVHLLFFDKNSVFGSKNEKRKD